MDARHRTAPSVRTWAMRRPATTARTIAIMMSMRRRRRSARRRGTRGQRNIDRHRRSVMSVRDMMRCVRVVSGCVHAVVHRHTDHPHHGNSRAVDRYSSHTNACATYECCQTCNLLPRRDERGFELIVLIREVLDFCLKLRQPGLLSLTALECSYMRRFSRF